MGNLLINRIQNTNVSPKSDPQLLGNDLDPNHPGCIRTVKAVTLTEIAVTGFDGATGGACNGKDDKPWGPLDGKVTGDTIVIDFSPKGGPSDLTGTWTPA